MRRTSSGQLWRCFQRCWRQAGPRRWGGQGTPGFAPQCGVESKVVDVPGSIPLHDNKYQHGIRHEAVRGPYGGNNSQQYGMDCRGQGTDDRGKQGGDANGNYQHDNQRGEVRGGYADGDYQHDNQHGDVQGTYSGQTFQQCGISSVNDGGGFQHGNVRNAQGGGDSHGCGFHHGNGRNTQGIGDSQIEGDGHVSGGGGRQACSISSVNDGGGFQRSNVRNTQGIGDSQIEGDGRVSGGGRQQAECGGFCQFQQGLVQVDHGVRQKADHRAGAGGGHMEHGMGHSIFELEVRGTTVFLLGGSGANLGGWTKSRTKTTTSTSWSTKRLVGPAW